MAAYGSGKGGADDGGDRADVIVDRKHAEQLSRVWIGGHGHRREAQCLRG